MNTKQNVAYWWAGKRRMPVRYPTVEDAFDSLMEHARLANEAGVSMRALGELRAECMTGRETELVQREHFAAMLSLADHYRAARRAASIMPNAEVHLRGSRVEIVFG